MRRGSGLSFIVAVAGMLLALAGGPALGETRALLIVVASSDDAPLPADAILEVELLDVSRADAPSVRLAAQRSRVRGWPVSIRLDYEDTAIDARMTYVVAARVVSGGTVLLRTTRAYPVLTRGAAEGASIVLDRSGGAAGR